VMDTSGVRDAAALPSSAGGAAVAVGRAGADGGTGSPGAEGWNLHWAGRLLVFVLICEIVPFSASIAGVALQAISAEYATGQGAWVMTAAFLTGAVTMPLIGKLADIYGKKQLLVICLLLSLVGIVVSAVAPTFLVFVLGRALQGFVTPVLFLSYSLIRDTFPKSLVASSAALTTGGLGVFSLISPLFVGPVIDSYGFKALYWIAAGYCLFVLLLGVWLVRSSPVRAKVRPDFVGAALLGFGFGSALLGLSFGPEDGWTSLTVVGFFVLGAGLLAGWFVQARVTAEPLINLQVLFGDGRRLLLIVLSTGLLGGAAIGAFSAYPLIAMTPIELGGDYGLGLTATQFGWLNIVAGVGVLGGIAVSVTAKLDPRIHLLLGALGTTVGLIVFAMGKSSIVWVPLALAAIMIAQGAVSAATPNLVIEAVRPEDQAVSASLPEMCRTLTASIATVVVFAVLNSNVRQYVEGQPIYSGHGYNLAFGAMAALALVGLVLAWLVPRRRRTVTTALN
uniref:MFS transporter n=1 Tax=Rhodococcus globerulus TaxID=33008 RepID=UPI003017CC6E